MKSEIFEERQSKFQKQQGYTDHLQDREKYAIDLRKCKRREHFQKYRQIHTSPLNLSIPPILLQEHPILQDSNFESKLRILSNLLLTSSNLKEILEYINSLLCSTESCIDLPEMFENLLYLVTSEPEIKHLVYGALCELTYLNQVNLHYEKLEKLLINASIEVKSFLIKICLNLVFNESIEFEKAQLMVMKVFVDEIGVEIFLQTLRFLELLAYRGFRQINLDAGFEWLLGRFVEEKRDSPEWIVVLLKARKNKIITRQWLMDHGLVGKVLSTIKLNPSVTLIGLKLIRKCLAEYLKPYTQYFSSEAVSTIETFIDFPNSQIQYESIRILVSIINFKSTGKSISQDFLKQTISSLSTPDEQAEFYTLKLLNFLQSSYPSLVKLTVKLGICKYLEHLKLCKRSKKFNREILNLCRNLIEYDEEVVSEFYQQGIFTVLESIEEFFDENSERIYEDLMNLNPGDEPTHSTPTEFKFS